MSDPHMRDVDKQMNGDDAATIQTVLTDSLLLLPAVSGEPVVIRRISLL